MFDSFFNFIFGPIMKLNPALAVTILSLILTAIVTFVYKIFTNQEMLKTMKEELKQHQNGMKESRNDPQKMMELQKKAMDTNLKYMTHSMKPTLITFIPIILIFGWLRNTFNSEKALITLPFSLPLIGNDLGWIGIYIITSIIFSMILRKIFKIH